MNYSMMGGAPLYDGYHRGFVGGMYGGHLHDGYGHGYGRGLGGLGDFGYGSRMYGMPPYGYGSFGLGNMLGTGYPYCSTASTFYDNPYASRYSTGRGGYGYNYYRRGGPLRRSLSLGSMRHGDFF